MDGLAYTVRVTKYIPSSSHLVAGEAAKEHPFPEAIHSAASLPAGKQTLLIMLAKLSTCS